METLFRICVCAELRMARRDLFVMRSPSMAQTPLVKGSSVPGMEKLLPTGITALLRLVLFIINDDLYQ